MQQPTAEQPSTRPKFWEDPDPNNKNYSSILQNIQRQEEQIMKVLNKYKDVIPDDQLEANDLTGITEKQNNKLIQSRKLKAAGLRKPKTKRLPINGDGYSHSYNKDINRTIDTSTRKKQAATQREAIAALARDQRQKLQLYKLNLTEKVRRNGSGYSKLPSVYMRTNSKKQQYEIDYEKVDKKYNQSVAKLYEGFAKDQYYNNISMEERNYGKIGKRQNKKVNRTIQQENNEIKGKQRAKNMKIRKFDNIFDPEEQQLQIQSDFPIQTEISKPIPYSPYKDIEQPAKQIKGSRSLVQHQQQKPTEVPMSYYSRNMNEKWRQQCQEQVNFLYFSRSDQTERDREWAQQIVRMFEKHDAEIQRMHKSMKYLESFDEGFFTAGIYQGDISKK